VQARHSIVQQLQHSSLDVSVSAAAPQRQRQQAAVPAGKEREGRCYLCLLSLLRMTIFKYLYKLLSLLLMHYFYLIVLYIILNELRDKIYANL
jgi:hypothetical protein